MRSITRERDGNRDETNFQVLETAPLSIPFPVTVVVPVLVAVLIKIAVRGKSLIAGSHFSSLCSLDRMQGGHPAVIPIIRPIFE